MYRTHIRHQFVTDDLNEEEKKFMAMQQYSAISGWATAPHRRPN